MNHKSILENKISNVNNAVRELEEARQKAEEAAEKTAEVLAIAESLGVKTVSIGKITPLVGNENWGFRAQGSIFTPHGAEVNGWPAAWAIAEQSGIYSGCGNSGQAQIDSSKVIDGVYQCKNGQWVRIKKYDD